MLRLSGFTLLLLIGIGLPGLDARAQFYASQLQAISQSAGQVGSEFQLSLTGQRLDEVDRMMFSTAAINAELQTLDPLPFTTARVPHYGHFQVRIPANLSPGRYEVRAGSRHGVTNPRAFFVTDRPVDKPDTISHQRSAPTEIQQDRLIHAVATAKAIDWFTFDVAEQEPLQIELIAQRLDSVLIGQIRLFDDQGNQIGSVRGSDRLDAILRTEPLTPGRYKLAIQDFVFRGGPEFHYLLLIHNAQSSVPDLGLEQAGNGRLAAYWSPSAIDIGDGNMQPAESNQADSDQQIVAIDVPANFTGWLPDGQTDQQFEFATSDSKSLTIDVVSERADQPTDIRMIVSQIQQASEDQPTLSQIAHADDFAGPSDGVISLASKDPVALLKPEPASSYRVTIRDLDIGTTLRSRQAFRLRLRTSEPRYDLVAYRVFPHTDPKATQPLATKLFRGGVEMIRVFAVRRDGWSGAIRIGVENLPPGVTCEEAVIAADQTFTQLTLKASEQASGAVDSIRVIGRGGDGTESIARAAAFATVTRGRSHGRGGIRSRLTTGLPVAVSSVDLAPLTISLGDDSIAQVKPGESVSLPVKLIRREGGKAPCVVRPRNLPGGASAAEITIAADASEGKIELKTNPNTKPGTYSIWWQVETKIKFAVNPQAAERAAAYRAHLQQLHDDPNQAENLAAIQSAIELADKAVEAAKAGATAQEQTVFIPTNHTTIQVVQP